MQGVGGDATLRLSLLLPFLLLLLLLIYLLLDNSREKQAGLLVGIEARPSINRLHLCAEFLTAMDSCDTERLIVHQDGSTATATAASITASGAGSGGGTASAAASTASTTSTRQQPSLLRLRRNTVYNN